MYRVILASLLSFTSARTCSPLPSDHSSGTRSISRCLRVLVTYTSDRKNKHARSLALLATRASILPLLRSYVILCASFLSEVLVLILLRATQSLACTASTHHSSDCLPVLHNAHLAHDFLHGRIDYTSRRTSWRLLWLEYAEALLDVQVGDLL